MPPAFRYVNQSYSGHISPFFDPIFPLELPPRTSPLISGQAALLMADLTRGVDRAPAIATMDLNGYDGD